MTHNTFTDDSYNNGWSWKSRPGYKPILFTIAALLFVAIILLPPPQGMIDMVSKVGPAGYKMEKGCTTITDTVNKKLRPEAFKETKHQVKQGESASLNKKKPLLSNREVAQMAKTMVAILFLAAFLWGTEALPLGATDIMVGVMLYLFVILPINEISKAYMKDAVFFIFGILAVAVGVAKTGLDKRIGLILLSRIKS
nr:anion permease [Desulfobacterales bacterium]